MTPERFQRLRTALDARQPDLTVLMEHTSKNRNFSAVLRTCDAVGVFEAHTVWNDADRHVGRRKQPIAYRDRKARDHAGERRRRAEKHMPMRSEQIRRENMMSLKVH